MAIIRAGKHTGEFGRWLTAYLIGNPSYQDYQVYYDHGDPDIDSNVVAIKGIYGEPVSRKNQLAQVDVLVATPAKELLAVVEIEERFSSPKKIIGDTFALLMCNQFSVKVQGRHQYFTIIPQTRLVVAGVMEMKGSKLKQLEEVIWPRMKSFAAPEDAIDMEKVRFIFKPSIEDILKELEALFLEWCM